MIFIDQNKRIIAVLVGRPEGDYAHLGQKLHDILMERLWPKMSQKDKACQHRRGNFGTTTHGFSRGGGVAVSRQSPANGLKDKKTNIPSKKPHQMTAGSKGAREEWGKIQEIPEMIRVKRFVEGT